LPAVAEKYFSEKSVGSENEDDFLKSKGR